MQIKKNTLIMTGIILVLAVSAGIWLISHKSSASSLNGTVIDVDQLSVDPSSYNGEIDVAGAVSFVYPEQGTFVIIDRKEYAQCGVVTCAINKLPVQYSGKLPKIKDIANIKGELVQTNQGFVLKAKEVTIE